MTQAERQSSGSQGPSSLTGGPEPPVSVQRHLAAWGAITLFYLVGVTLYWWPTPDSALYLSLGRSLAEGQGYVFNGEVCNAVTPGLPLILAGIRIILGESMWGPNLFVAACGFGAIVLYYRIVARLAGGHTGLAVAACVAFSYTFYLLSHLVLTEAPTALAVAMLLYLQVTWRVRPFWMTLGLSLVLSIVCVLLRAPILGLLLLVGVGVMLDRHGQSPLGRRVLAGAVLLLTVVGMGAGLYLLATSISQTTPLYVQTPTDALYGGGSLTERVLRTVPGVFWQFPETLAEMTSSQSGVAMGATVGMGLLVALFVGGWDQWRRGNRLIPFLAVSYPAGTALLLGGWAVRPRYLMPIQFLLMFLCLHGMCVLVGGLWKLRGKVLTPWGSVRVLEVFLALVVVANMPRVAKVSFYHQYLSLSGRFYEKIRHSEFPELPAVRDTLRNDSLPNGVIAALNDEVSVFHFLSQHRVVGFPLTAEEDHWTAADAEAVVSFVVSRDDIDLVVFDWSKGSEEFQQRLRTLAESSQSLVPIRTLKRFHIYRRTQPSEVR